jgi:hypothetical protein
MTFLSMRIDHVVTLSLPATENRLAVNRASRIYVSLWANVSYSHTSDRDSGPPRKSFAQTCGRDLSSGVPKKTA